MPTCLSTKQKICVAYGSGFQFFELFLLGKNIYPQLPAYKACARAYNMPLRFHDGWTYREGHKSWANFFADVCGLLPRKESEKRLPNIISAVNGHPCVIYAEHAQKETLPENMILQTYPTIDEHGTFRISLKEFVERINRKNYGVAFDTQHMLEMAIGTPGISNFGKYSSNALLDILIEKWHALKNHVAEIHLCDSRPTKSLFGGSNVWPGTGVLPLKSFCEEVARSGWVGPVSIEVAPYYIYNTEKLRHLRETAERLFHI